ncbi:MAG: hypothetical protein WC890_01345 [Candidatus Margulisiibacteriota bacterium]
MSTSFIPPPLPWAGVSIADPGYGVSDYNPGQDSTASSAFMSSLSDLFIFTGDVSAEIKSELNMSDAQWLELFPAEVSTATWDQLLTADPELSNLGLVLNSVDTLKEFLDTISSYSGNDEYWQALGYYDSQLICSLIEMAKLPSQFSSEVISGLQSSYQKMIDASNVTDILDVLDSSHPDEDKLRDLLASLKGYIEEEFGISLSDIDPNLDAVLSGQYQNLDAVRSAIDSLQNGDLLDSVIEKINSQNISEETMETIDEIANSLEMSSITPAVATVGLNITAQAMSNTAMALYKIAVDRAEKTDMEDKQIAAKARAEHRAELEKAGKEADQKNSNKIKSQRSAKNG